MEMLTLNMDSKIQLEPDLLYSKIGDEIVLLTIESGKYFKVDAVGSRVWELIKEPILIKILCQQLIEEYDISLKECLTDVISFLKKLLEDKLIHLC